MANLKATNEGFVKKEKETANVTLIIPECVMSNDVEPVLNR